MNRSTVKRATESFLVNLAGATTMPTSGTLVNSSTGNVNLTEGQLGIINVSPLGGSTGYWSFVDATPTAAEAPQIAIVQGTSASGAVGTTQTTYPLWVRPYEISATLDGSKKDILVTKQPFRIAKHNVWTVGVPSSATTGLINVVDSSVYSVNIAFSGRDIEEFYSDQQAASTTISFTSPNFTDLSATYPLPIDYLVTKTVYEINRNSQAFPSASRYQGSDPVVAFAVGLANSGPSGAAAGTQISGLTAGTVVNVFVSGGATRTITLTQEMVDSLQAAATASGFTYILTSDMTQAGTTAGGTATGFMVMALDRTQAYVDYVPQVKTRLRVSLKSGYDYLTVTTTESVKTDEGQGYGRVLDLLYKATQGQRKYIQRHTQDPIVNFPSPIVTTQQYVVYNIHHGAETQVDHSNTIFQPFREIICIPRYSTGTTTNPLIATFDTVLGAWLSSTGNSAIVDLG